MTADGTPTAPRAGETITTAAGYEELPIGSVLVHPLDPAWTLTRGSYADGRPWGGSDGKRYASVTVAAHDFTVLFRPDAPQPAATGEVEWGVRHAEAGWEGSDLDTWDVRGYLYDEATARFDAAKREGSRVVQRTVSAWREVS